MHPGQERVVAPVIEMRHAALVGVEIPHRRRLVERAHPRPAHSDHRFRVEVEAPHPELLTHHLAQGHDRVHPEAEQGITDSRPERFEVDPPVGYATPLHAQIRRARVEHRNSQHHAGRLGRGSRHELADQLGRVLPVRIHRQDMRESGGLGKLDAVQDRRAFATVPGQYHHPQTRIGLGHLAQSFGRTVGARIHDDPHRIPDTPCRLDRLIDSLAGVVAWNQDKVTPGSLLHPVLIVRQAGWCAAAPRVRWHPCRFCGRARIRDRLPYPRSSLSNYPEA